MNTLRGECVAASLRQTRRGGVLLSVSQLSPASPSPRRIEVSRCWRFVSERGNMEDNLLMMDCPGVSGSLDLNALTIVPNSVSFASAEPK